ncbi:hypothetical protein [Clostridium sp. CF012]|uniref:hypothetical protein n=1 Tax=Clostridium sp. CF012 TaxID=2843319 RepID=UPI001C0E5AA1|nr:hypothetical protein [Clostridium sp. CF012]MBU3144186.1 hypothetical protein [Clostridium sp. CF012]
MNNEDKILKILGQIQGDMQLVKIQLKEHGEMLNSLKVASEFHKADIDNLTHEVVNMSGELKAEIKETNLKIDTIAKDLSFVELATGKNITDIAYLKYAK